MSKKFLIANIIIIFFSTIAFSQTTYTFNGNGNWTDSSNWLNHNLPPDVLPSGAEIIIDPPSEAVCNLNTKQIVISGAKFTIRAQKKMIVNGNLSMTDSSTKNIWTIMSNSTDPMLAIAKTDTTEIAFFGDRDSAGIPYKLKLFIVKTKTDTISYWLDEAGRPLAINNTNGFQFKYVWNSATEADCTVTSVDGKYILSFPIVLTRQKNNQGRASQGLGTTAISNLIVNVIRCGLPVTSPIGDVQIQLQVVQGTQEKTLFPAYFVNGKYVASLPTDVPLLINPAVQACNIINTVLSNSCDAYSFLGLEGDIIMTLTCNALSIALAGTQIGAPVAALFQTACLSVTTGFDLYCKTIGGSAVPGAPTVADLLCSAKFFKRVYNEGIYLQPSIYLNGRTIVGELLSTIGGSQQIDLKLEINDCSFTDPRDGQIYPYKQIGTQVWMTQNLNYAAPGSWCYDNNATNCDTYGRLYDWNTALTVAPPGWHLPSDTEWSTLTTFLGGEPVAGGKMKSTTLWNAPNTGATNYSGFAGLPGAGRLSFASFYNLGYFGYWWSSTEMDTYHAWNRNLHHNNTGASRTYGDKTYGFSVRCVKD